MRFFLLFLREFNISKVDFMVVLVRRDLRVVISSIVRFFLRDFGIVGFVG